MGMRTARQGSWKKEKSISSEHHKYKEYAYKERLNKENKPTDSWDDVFLNPQRSWKKHRKYQCKNIRTKIAPKIEVPFSGMPLQHTSNYNKNAYWYKSEIYYVVEVGYFWHDGKYGVYLTNSLYKNTTDPDYASFIEIKDLWKHFRKLN